MGISALLGSRRQQLLLVDGTCHCLSYTVDGHVGHVVSREAKTLAPPGEKDQEVGDIPSELELGCLSEFNARPEELEEALRVSV